MLVRDRMSTPPVTIMPETPFQDALKLMREQRFRRLPVVNRSGELIGIVSERDLLYATPSPANSLSVWELQYLLSQLQVQNIMSKEVVTTTADTPIEDAAEVMARRKIGGMPVVDENNYVLGVITETDIFNAFVEMMAAEKNGLRLTLEVPDRMGVLADLAVAIDEAGGHVVSVGTYQSASIGLRRLLVKVQGLSKGQLVEISERLGDHIVDARETSRPQVKTVGG
ncbi:MAG: CBS and ACT domain-containing protein [Caldilineaceae bacterium]|nr:CBS domain-containing protein [Caldilineaceae bacterium]